MSIKIKRKRERSFVSFLQFNYHFSFLCANFLKTEVRSHSFPRPLSAGEKRAEAKRKILFPQKNCFFVFPSPYLSPATPPETLRAEPQKEKCPFHFRKNPPPRK